MKGRGLLVALAGDGPHIPAAREFEGHTFLRAPWAGHGFLAAVIEDDPFAFENVRRL